MNQSCSEPQNFRMIKSEYDAALKGADERRQEIEKYLTGLIGSIVAVEGVCSRAIIETAGSQTFIRTRSVFDPNPPEIIKYTGVLKEFWPNDGGLSTDKIVVMASSAETSDEDFGGVPLEMEVDGLTYGVSGRIFPVPTLVNVVLEETRNSAPATYEGSNLGPSWSELNPTVNPNI